MPRIHWINHAGLIIQNAHTAIMCDPWLEGTILNNGWELLVPTEKNLDFSPITHLWYSHEHPDHFNTRSLSIIQSKCPAPPEVLFQETKDRRLLKYCQKKNLPVRELMDRKRQQLAEGVYITVGKNGVEDSWSMIEMDGIKFLNLNDCMFGTRGHIREIRDSVGEADVLLTIFSYAEKVGNADDVAQRIALARHFMDLMRIEAEMFNPKYLIPFASFKYFSHEENFYLNNGAGTAKEAHEFLKDKVKARTLVLFPGDVWEYGAEHDSLPAMQKYAEAGKAIKPVQYNEKHHTLDELVQLSLSYTKEVASVHGKSRLLKLMALSGLTTLRLWLTDMQAAAVLRINAPLKAASLSRKACDVEVSTPSVAYLLQHMSGGNTLMGNGRYQATKWGHTKLYIISYLMLMVSANEPLSLGYVLKNIVKVVSTLSQRVRKF